MNRVAGIRDVCLLHAGLLNSAHLSCPNPHKLITFDSGLWELTRTEKTSRQWPKYEVDYFWDTSEVGHKNSISTEMPPSCSESSPKLSRLDTWFYWFDLFQRNKHSEAAISAGAQGSSLEADSGGSRESWPSPGCAKSSNAPGAPSAKSHLFLVFIKHHLQGSDSLSFRVKLLHGDRKQLGRFSQPEYLG